MMISSYTIWTITFIVVTDTEVPNISCVEFGTMAFWQMAATDNSGDVPEITCYQPRQLMLVQSRQRSHGSC